MAESWQRVLTCGDTTAEDADGMVTTSLINGIPPEGIQLQHAGPVLSLRSGRPPLVLKKGKLYKITIEEMEERK